VAHRKRQAAERLAAGSAWQDNNLVFCHEDGRMYSKDALNWRFSKMTRRAGIGHWYAHEGRHTAVSIRSSNGVPLQDISDTVIATATAQYGSDAAAKGQDAWIVSGLPRRLFSRDQAITAMVLAERLAAGHGDDDLFVIGWREELGR
jgi:hypothetical protein